MNKPIKPFLVVLGAILASGIQAQEIPAELLSCASLDDDAERLSCFDREMTRQLLASREQPAITTTNVVIPEGSAAAVPAEDSPTVVAVTAAEEQFDNPQLSDLDPISPTVTRVDRRPHGEHVVYLDNGQVWSEQTKSSYFPVKTGETVTIKKRKYGGYRLVTESGKAYDVERLR